MGDLTDHNKKIDKMIRKGLTTVEKVSRTSSEEEMAKYGRKHSWRLYGTDAAYCPRKAVLYGAEERVHETRPEGKMYMALGTAAEDVLVDGFHNSGMLLWKQYRVPEGEINVGGKVDIIAFLEYVFGVEVKTCEKVPDQPKPEHEAQALLYSLLLGIPFKLLYQSRKVVRSVPGGRVELDFGLLDVDTSHERLWATAVGLARSYVYSLERLLPERPSHFTKTGNCTYCPFKQMCYGSEPFPIPVPGPGVREDVEARVRQLATLLMDQRPSKKIGMLKFLQENNERARAVLEGADWSKI